MDAFSWSLPFVGEKMMDMLGGMLSICTEEELADENASKLRLKSQSSGSSSLKSEEQIVRREVLRKKIRAVGRISLMFNTLRQEKELVSEVLLYPFHVNDILICLSIYSSLNM